MVPTPVADALSRVFLGNSVQAWLTAAATAAITFLVFIIARRLLVSRLGAIAARTTNRVDDTIIAMVAATRTWVCLALAVLIAISGLHLPSRMAGDVGPVSRLILLWQVAVWGGAVISTWMKFHLERRTAENDRTSVAMISAMGVGAKVILWILVLITALKSVFNIEVTALITGLGVSGIAIALAVQNILGDLIAALSIVFDKPFDVGDTIGVDQIIGTVERIGLKTTRIRSLSGEQIIIGNGDLLKSRLRNLRRMYQRRVVFAVDVLYSTPPDVLQTLPDIVKSVVAEQNPVKVDRSHVSSLGESAIRIETVYYVLDPDYAKYMDVQQAVILGVMRRFAAVNVEFAFPTRTLYHEGLPQWELLKPTPGS